MRTAGVGEVHWHIRVLFPAGARSPPFPIDPGARPEVLYPPGFVSLRLPFWRLPAEVGEMRLIRCEVAFPARPEESWFLEQLACEIVATRPSTETLGELLQEPLLITPRKL
jgi:hypothetical protein